MTEAPTKIVQTRHGPMRILTTDVYVSRCLDVFGEYGRAEWELLAQIVKPGMVVVEAGANFGAFTIPLARACAPGRLFAFEPQPFICELLRENLSANGARNAVAIQAAVGAASGEAELSIPDYGQQGNFGGVAISASAGGERVQVIPIDALELQELALLKVDVEGAELETLKGAASTIRRCRPILYLENDRAEHQGALIAATSGMNYRLYWHTPLLADRGNFNGVTEGIFGAPVRSLNMLCLPAERERQVRDLVEIDPKNWVSPIPLK